MKLIVDKLARIFHAELDFDGITVVAGANNTGKSNALCAMFTAFSDIDSRVRRGREAKCRELLNDFRDRFTNFGFGRDIDEFAADIVSKRISTEEVRSILTEAKDYEHETPDVEEWVARLKEVCALSDDDIKSQEVLNVFSSVFKSQCGSLYYPKSFPLFDLEIKKKNLSAKITSGLPECLFGVKLTHSAFYIDSPEALVDIGRNLSSRFFFPWNDVIEFEPYVGFENIEWI